MSFGRKRWTAPSMAAASTSAFVSGVPAWSLRSRAYHHCLATISVPCCRQPGRNPNPAWRIRVHIAPARTATIHLLPLLGSEISIISSWNPHV